MDLRTVNIVAMAPLAGIDFEGLRVLLANHGVLDEGRSAWLGTH